MGITRYDEVGYWSELKLDIVRKYTQASNAAVAAAYRERLQQVAGFEYVPAPMPMRNTRARLSITCSLHRLTGRGRRSYPTSLTGTVTGGLSDGDILGH